MLTTQDDESDSLDEAVDIIAREIGLDEGAIAARKAFLELGDDEIALLRDIHLLVGGHDAAFSDELYDHLLGFPALQALAPDEASVTRLRRTQAGYFASLTAGDYGAQYVRDRLRVGVVYQRMGLEPQWYLGAYRKYLEAIAARLAQRLRDEPRRFRASCDALLKIALFDMGLALDTYVHAGQRSVLQYQNYLEQVIGAMPAGLVVVDGDCRVRSANATMCAMLGISAGAIESQPRLDTLIPSAELAQRMAAALASGAPQDHVLVMLGETQVEEEARDEPRWFEFNIRRSTQAGGHLLLLIGQDVTFRRQARLRLQESEEFFRLTFTQAAVGIALLSREGRFVRVNRKLTQILGYAESELLQRFFHQITYGDDLLEDRALIARLAEGGIGDFQRETRCGLRCRRPRCARRAAGRCG
jgi:PAS domain S-box-containing protein